MGTLALKSKLIEQFNQLIKDESKLDALDGIFDALKVIDAASVVPEKHYKIVDERRKNRLAGETEGLSWDKVKSQLKDKHGL